MWKYTIENGMLARHPHDCVFGVVVGISELKRLAPHIPTVVTYIARNRACVYDLLADLTACWDDIVRAIDAPYVGRL